MKLVLGVHKVIGSDAKGIAAARDGTVYAFTLAPLTLLQFNPESLK
jgi:hypothetical protein